MQSTSFVRRFLPLAMLGIVGVIALLVANREVISNAFAAIPELANLPMPVQLLINGVQPVIFVVIASMVGAALSTRLGLRSKLAGDTVVLPRNAWWQTLGLGVAVCLVVIVLDLLTRGLMPPVKPGSEALLSGLSHTTVASVLGALLYGGITEEVLLRWGLMTLLIWLGWRLLQKGEGAPKAGLVWTMIVVTAVLFGLGHLPTTAMTYDLTPFVVMRAIVFNGLFGVLAGWLYWKYCLEMAMLAHMAFHVVLTVVNLALVALA
mgnify:CR=1 FL=1|jgi:hypothetical protein